MKDATSLNFERDEVGMLWSAPRTQPRGEARESAGAANRRRPLTHSHERAVGPPHGPAGYGEALERLRRGHLVDEVQVDVEEVVAVATRLHDVLVPDLVVHGARPHGEEAAARGGAARGAERSSQH